MRETSHDLVAAKATRLQQLAHKAAKSKPDDTPEPISDKVYQGWNN